MVSQPASLGVKPQSGVEDQVFVTVSCGFILGALSDERRGSVIYNCYWFSRTQSFLLPSPVGLNDHILLSQIRDSHSLQGHVPVFISLRDRVILLYPQVLGFPFCRFLLLARLSSPQTCLDTAENGNISLLPLTGIQLLPSSLELITTPAELSSLPFI
jgi:hypothetical protein